MMNVVSNVMAIRMYIASTTLQYVRCVGDI